MPRRIFLAPWVVLATSLAVLACGGSQGGPDAALDAAGVLDLAVDPGLDVADRPDATDAPDAAGELDTLEVPAPSDAVELPDTPNPVDTHLPSDTMELPDNPNPVDAQLPSDAPELPDNPNPIDASPPSDAVDAPDRIDADVLPDDPGPEAIDWHLPALSACQPAATACEAAPAELPALASLRADYFLPYEQYPEDRIDDPAGGRRVQVAAVAVAGGTITKVEIRGRDVTPLALPRGQSGPTPPEVLALTGDGKMQWVHVWPLALTAGEPFLVAFHADDAALDGEATIPIRVTTDAGIALEAEVPLARPAVPVTYVTTSPDLGSILVHARNDDTVPRTLVDLTVNGLDVTDAACIASRTLQPGRTALWTVPLCRPLQPGAPWTVVARFEGAPASVGVGRVILPLFPIHAWVNESECPFPGANRDNYLAHRDKGFDMPFLRGSFAAEGCNNATAAEIVSRSAHIPDQYYLLDEWANVDGLDDSRLARLLGDEVDDRIEDKPYLVSQDAKANWLQSPRMTTYIGGARHRRTGAFAGIADVQGFDIYFAACAPSILDGALPPMRAPFDYCQAVRRNQMPGPNWFYSQGIAGWGPDESRRDPDAMELKVSAMSVAACGSKGLMYFMTNLERSAAVPATWEAMGEVNRVLRAVREFLREGDATGGARAADPDVLLDAIRSRDAIVVPVVNAKALQVVDYVRCLFETDPHWVLADVTTDVTVTIPDDFAVADLWEVVDGAVVPVAEAAFARGRELTIPGVALSNDRPYRMFVLARTADVADRMRAAVPMADVGPEPGPATLSATAACAPTLDRCATPAADPGILASLRKDFFYPYQQYPEAGIPDPVDGGRVQVTALAAASGLVTSIEVNGRDVTALASDAPGEDAPPGVTALTDDDWMHWIHVWPRQVTAGQPVFAAFHSGQRWLDESATVAIRVRTDQGDAVNGTFAPARPAVPFGYVTTPPTYDAFLLHLRNTDAAPHTLSRLVLNGRDVTDAACIPARTVDPGEAVLWTVPLCTPAARGDAWTVVAEWTDAVPSTAGGRVLAPHFGINSWPTSTDCPFPGANDANWRRHWEAGFDTPFLWKQTYANYEGCNGADAQSILAAAEQVPGQWLMVDTNTPVTGHSTDRLLWFVGDEPDSEVGDAPWNKSRRSLRHWLKTPEMATYVGGSRHRHNGAFAGVTDIQGFDIYVSACPPYILDYGNFPPLRAPFDFARAVRFNQSPGPTWFYSHGMLGKKDPVREPSPSELWVQALSPIAAGTKGLMYFQSNMGGAQRRPASWAAIAAANRMIRSVRSMLVLGDPTGQASADDPDVLVDAIRAPDALVVPVIDAKAEVAMTDVRCLFEEDPHWRLAHVGATVRVTVPDDLGIFEVFEVRDGAVVPPAGMPYALGRDLVIPSVMLSESRPVRMFILAANASVAERVRRDLVVPELPVP